jgi:hypothetical protein
MPWQPHIPPSQSQSTPAAASVAYRQTIPASSVHALGTVGCVAGQVVVAQFHSSPPIAVMTARQVQVVPPVYVHASPT